MPVITAQNASPRLSCGGCDETWTGVGRCHCSVCHRTFGGSSGFDQHRSRGQCHDPAALGMHPNPQGVWIRETDRVHPAIVRGRRATPSG
jgi:hypothetical protein